jgi:FKBP-type peptidyl-prolyl cis-trans isomerase FklB
VRFSYLLFCILLSASVTAQQLDSQSDTLSFYLGIMFGGNLDTATFPDLDPELVSAGLEAGRRGAGAVSPQEARTYLQNYLAAAAERAAAEQRAKQTAFLTENAQREGVVQTPSGLQYEVLRAGTGATPTDTSTVTVHYTGKLTDGTVFDSSVERGQPADFGVTQVIAGWTEGLKLMQEGAEYRFYIPSELGYGPRGSGRIPAHSTLIFDVELLDVR